MNHMCDESASQRKKCRALDVQEQSNFELIRNNSIHPEQLQIDSKCGGCNYAFITKVLDLALAYTRSTTDPSTGKYLCLPFATEDVMSWLQQASVFCVDHPQYKECLGGSELDPRNMRSFWRSPKQLNTWWKNNVERKDKYNRLRLIAGTCLSGTLDETDSAFLFDKRLVLMSKLLTFL